MTQYGVTAIKHPFGVGERWEAIAAEGSTILELVERVPERYYRYIPQESLSVQVNGHPVPRAMWPYVRPRPDGPVPIHVNIGPIVQGGGAGGDSGKSVIAAVASLAIIAFTAFVAAPFAVGALGLAAGSTAASLVSGAVIAAGSVAASLARSALSPPPAAQARSSFENDTAGKELGSAFADGNILAPGGAIPVSIGRRKIHPPFACQPLVEIVGDDEIVEALYCLNGPHNFENIKSDNVPIEDLPGVEWQTREGWDSDQRIFLVQRYSDTQSLNVKLVGHTCDPDTTELEDQNSPENSLPQWQRAITAKNADEIWLALNFQGFSDTEDPTKIMAVPVRIRIRQKGTTTWKGMPELHFTANTYSLVRKQVKLKWSDPLASLPTPPTTNGPYSAFKETMGQDGDTANPATDAWVAHSSFDGGAGLTNVANVAMYQDRVEIFLSEADFPRDTQYEVEIMRGYAHEKEQFTTSSYSYNDGSTDKVRDFFSYDNAGGGAAIAVSSNKTVTPLTVSRVSSVFNRHPVQAKGLALLAVRGVNIGIANLSAEVARYVRDWNGSDWSDWSTTANPAPHFRDVLTGNLTTPQKRTPATEIDDANLVDFRSWAASKSHEVAAIIDERSMGEVLTAIASSAYGRLKRSHNVGVIIDRDRSNDTYKQIFTPRDSRNFTWSKTFIEPADGFRVNYVDQDEDWATKTIKVYAEGVIAETASLLEEITYDTMVDESAVRTRAAFDLAQKEARSNIYSLETHAKYLSCQRGDLVGVSNDILIRQSGWARIKSISRNGSNEITSIGLDSTLEMPDSTPLWDVADFWSVSDFWTQGQKAHSEVQISDGSTVNIGVVTGGGADPLFSNQLIPTVLAENDGIEVGNQIVIGSSETVFKRMLVLDITPGKDLTASLTLVDEAPDIHVQPELTLSGTASATLTAAATFGVDGSGELTGSATASLAATATLGKTAPLSGTAIASLSASAELLNSVAMTGAAELIASGSATFGVEQSLSGYATLSSSASAVFAVSKPMSGSAITAAAATAAMSKQDTIWNTSDFWAEADFWSI